METTQKIKTANILRNIARYVLLTLGILVFLFALVSGSEQYGGGLQGILKNSPNALPWVILLAAVYIAWKRELAGGILITLAGVGMLILFILKANNFYWPVLLLVLLILVLGVFFILSWRLRRKDAMTNDP